MTAYCFDPLPLLINFTLMPERYLFSARNQRVTET
jgi:hypothetical protein